MCNITQLSQLDFSKIYSYTDYLTWQFDQAVELIKGKISLILPTPNVNHQSIARNLIIDINYLRGKKSSVFPAPFDVRLYDRKKSLLANQDIHTVV
jgi:hypothetical protein